MIIIKRGKKQPKDYAMFQCAVCECEWAEEAKKVNEIEESFDPMRMIRNTMYVMRCPCCGTKTATYRVERIVLEEGELNE